jgi:hypothetical protein
MKTAGRARLKAMIYWCAAPVFLLALVNSLSAQTRSNGTTTMTASKRAEQDLMNREWNLTHIPDEVNKQFKTEQVSVFPQVQEDFTRIQIINNNMMQMVFVNKSFDYKLISATTEEMKKRALRLRQNLLLPKTPEDAKNPKSQGASSDEQLKASLLTLDHSVVSFVTNPLFKLPNVIDPKLAETARNDLERIILFTEAIRKDAEKLSKTSAQRRK